MPRSFASASDSNSVQVTELEALSELLSKDFECISKGNSFRNASFRIRVHAVEVGGIAPFVWLRFQYPDGYPDMPVSVSVESGQGLSRTQQTALQRKAHDTAESCVGMEMVFSIVLEAERMLNEWSLEVHTVDKIDDWPSVSDLSSCTDATADKIAVPDSARRSLDMTDHPFTVGSPHAPAVEAIGNVPGTDELPAVQGSAIAHSDMSLEGLDQPEALALVGSHSASPQAAGIDSLSTLSRSDSELSFHTEVSLRLASSSQKNGIDGEHVDVDVSIDEDEKDPPAVDHTAAGFSASSPPCAVQSHSSVISPLDLPAARKSQSGLESGGHDVRLARPPPKRQIRWKRGELLGAGRFGKVCRGINLDTGEFMAVKRIELNPAHSHMWPRQLIAVQREVELLSRLNHPNIVRYLGSDTERFANGAINLFMEYVPGGTLASVAKSMPETLDEEIVARYTVQILKGLNYLHQQGYVHRDIKGSNILIDQHGVVKLADFGSAKAIITAGNDESLAKSMRGTPYWMAPEVIRQTGHGKAADVWSIGATVVELLSGGEPPFSDAYSNEMAAMIHVFKTVISVPVANSELVLPRGISQECTDFLNMCFSADPKHRPSTEQLLAHPFVARFNKPTATPSTDSLLSSQMSAASLTFGDMTETDESLVSASRVASSAASIMDHTTTGTSTQAGKSPKGQPETVVQPQELAVSRYATDFDELDVIGNGASGQVLLARNRLDDQLYAVKRVALSDDIEVNKKLMREVATVSRLSHPNIVRYYQAWIECPGSLLRTGSAGALDDDRLGDSAWSLQTLETIKDMTDAEVKQWMEFADVEDSGNTVTLLQNGQTRGDDQKFLEVLSSPSRRKGSSTSSAGGTMPEKSRTKYLFIQMEYCEQRTLRHYLEDRREGLDEPTSWKYTRQLMEALKYIHEMGIIHRDVKPSNIFVAANGSLKLGDFGLATFQDQSGNGALDFWRMTPPEELPRSMSSSTGTVVCSTAEAGSNGVSEITGGLGTLFYTAPEQGSDGYDAKVDVYAMGVVLFELWHPMASPHDRASSLMSIRRSNTLPRAFEKRYPAPAKLIKLCLNPDPASRPTVLQMISSPDLPVDVHQEVVHRFEELLLSADTAHKRQLLQPLFSRGNTLGTTASYDHAANAGGMPAHLRVRSSLVSIFSEVAHQHGCFQLHAPLISASQGVQNDLTIPCFLDQNGVLVSLVHDLATAFARYVALRGVRSVRRFYCGRVYRSGRSGATPAEMWEGVFDIVTPQVHSPVSDVKAQKRAAWARFAHCSEVVKFAVDLIRSMLLEKLGKVSVTVSHSYFLPALLDAAGVPAASRTLVQVVLSRYCTVRALNGNNGKKNPDQFKELESQLSRVSNISRQQATLLVDMITACTSLEAWPKVVSKYCPAFLGKAKLLVVEMDHLVSCLRAMGIGDQVTVVPCCFPSSVYTGVIFEAHLRIRRSLETVLYGGEYTDLVAELKNTSPERASAPGTDPVYCTGATVLLEKLVQIILRAEQNAYKHSYLTVPEASTFAECESTDVILVSSDGSLDHALLKISSMLWKAGVSSRFVTADKSGLNAVLNDAADNYTPFVVVLKRKVYAERHQVTLHTTETRRDEIVSEKGLVRAVLAKLQALHDRRRRRSYLPGDPRWRRHLPPIGSTDSLESLGATASPRKASTGSATPRQRQGSSAASPLLSVPRSSTVAPLEQNGEESGGSARLNIRFIGNAAKYRSSQDFIDLMKVKLTECTRQSRSVRLIVTEASYSCVADVVYALMASTSGLIGSTDLLGVLGAKHPVSRDVQPLLHALERVNNSLSSQETCAVYSCRDDRMFVVPSP